MKEQNVLAAQITELQKNQKAKGEDTTEHHPLIPSPQEHTNHDHPQLDTLHINHRHARLDINGAKTHKTAMTAALVAIAPEAALIQIHLSTTKLQMSDHHFHVIKIALRLPTTLVLPEIISGTLPSP